MKKSKKSIKIVSKNVMDFLSINYGMFYFSNNFKEEIYETVEWFDLDIDKSISHLVCKYDLQILAD